MTNRSILSGLGTNFGTAPSVSARSPVGKTVSSIRSTASTSGRLARFVGSRAVTCPAKPSGSTPQRRLAAAQRSTTIACKTVLANPVAVSDPATAADVTPLGVRGLGGNLAEWALDSFYSLDAPCWNGASLVDPVCWEKNPLFRTSVGSDWYSVSAVWRRFISVSGGSIEGEFFHVDAGSNDVGFRCAYQQEPR